jgi:hypothetical protein
MIAPEPPPPLPTARGLGRAFGRLAAELCDHRRRALPRLTSPGVPDAVLLVPAGRFRTDGSGGPDPDTAGTGRSLSWLLGEAMEVRANNHFGLVWRTAVRPQCRGSWPAAPKRITSWRCSPRQVATALSSKPKTGSAVSLAGPLAGQDVQVGGGEPPVTLSGLGPTRPRSRFWRHRCPRQASFAGRPRRRLSKKHSRLIVPEVDAHGVAARDDGQRHADADRRRDSGFR